MYDNTPIKSANEVDTARLPRLLCLHGGGSNAKIFRSQCRVLSKQLQGIFRLCFVAAPWTSEAGPDVTSVYQDYQPFRRWLRWRPWHPELDAFVATREIEQSIETAMKEDDMKGASGEWVGLLGFSQGAKMCASLLLRQQDRARLFGANHPAVRTHYRFAVLFASSGPLVSLDPTLLKSPALVDASQIGQVEGSESMSYQDTRHVLQLPTLHIHGMRDQGLPRHRHFLDMYCQQGSTRVVMWDGEHRMPIKSRDVACVVEQILEVARQTGALGNGFDGHDGHDHDARAIS